MSHLRQLLDDVLSRRKIVDDRYTFDLLRHVAPDKTEELNNLEGEAIGRRSQPTITAVERLYRQMKQPTQPAESTTSSPKPDEPTITLTRADLDDILASRRSATPAELDWLLSHKRELRITSREDFDLREMGSKLSAKARQGQQRRPTSPTEDFITTTLGLFQTRFGDLTREEITKVEGIRRAAAQSIFACRNHSKDRCRCWAFARTALYEIRQRVGEKSAIGVAALAVWNSLDALAASPRPELT